MKSVPQHFSLKSVCNNLYLRYIHEENELKGFLQYSGEEVVSPFTRFVIEKASGRKGYVHIRCSYNNKYWVLHSPTSHYIVAEAKEKEEDQSKTSCTLFMPEYDQDDKNLDVFRFRHVHLNRILQFQEAPGSPHHGCLEVKLGSSKTNGADLSTAVNCDTLFILPKYIGFKNIGYDNYLRPDHRLLSKKNIVDLVFKSSDPEDPGVRHEVITTRDGHIRIKNVPYGKFWTLEQKLNCIVLGDNEKSDHQTTSEDTFDPRTLFWPIKLGRNVVALRSMANNCFCRRLSVRPVVNGLNADHDYITDEAKLEIIDLVLSRKVYNVHFHLSDARVYDEKPVVMSSTSVENNNSEDQKFTMKLSYEDTTTSTWDTTVSTTLGVKMSIQTGVPKVAEAEIEVSAEMSEEYAWGETQQFKCLAEIVHEVTVPSWTKVRGSIMATEANCDIPFSYTQRDKLMNGKYVTRRHHDGVYKVVNSYNFHFVAEHV